MTDKKEDSLSEKAEKFFTGDWRLNIAEKDGNIVPLLSKDLPAEDTISAMKVQEHAVRKFLGPYADVSKETGVSFHPADDDNSQAQVVIQDIRRISDFIADAAKLNKKLDDKHQTRITLSIGTGKRLFPDKVPELAFGNAEKTDLVASNALIAVIKNCGITAKTTQHFKADATQPNAATVDNILAHITAHTRIDRPL